MKYLCLGYLDPAAMDTRPVQEIDALMGRCAPHMEALRQTGRLVTVAGLEKPTKSLRRVGGRLSITDGPFTETKELLGSVFIVEADSLEAAAELAALHPTTAMVEGEAFGWRLEVRAIHSYEQRGSQD